MFVKEDDINMNFDEEEFKDNELFIQSSQLLPFIQQMNQNYRQDINRTQQSLEQRQELPIYKKESEIVDCITNNLITLICGETGSGKST